MAERIYKVKDVDMLLASKTIVETLNQNLEELSAIRSIWNQDYVDNLSTKIDDAIENYLGMDQKKELRDTTSKLVAIQVPAQRDLSFIKTQIEVDFDNRADEMIKTLGYDKNLRAVQKGDQEALIELLYRFKHGLTEELKAEITQKGTSPELIDRIIGYADKVKQLNVSQESLKESTKSLSEEAVNTFNDIYDEVIGICKIAANFYQYDPIKQEQFTFSKTVGNMNAARKMAETVE